MSKKWIIVLAIALLASVMVNVTLAELYSSIKTSSIYTADLLGKSEMSNALLQGQNQLLRERNVCLNSWPIVANVSLTGFNESPSMAMITFTERNLSKGQTLMVTFKIDSIEPQRVHLTIATGLGTLDSPETIAWQIEHPDTLMVIPRTGSYRFILVNFSEYPAHVLWVIDSVPKC